MFRYYILIPNHIGIPQIIKQSYETNFQAWKLGRRLVSRTKNSTFLVSCIITNRFVEISFRLRKFGTALKKAAPEKNGFKNFLATTNFFLHIMALPYLRFWVRFKERVREAHLLMRLLPNCSDIKNHGPLTSQCFDFLTIFFKLLTFLENYASNLIILGSIKVTGRVIPFFISGYLLFLHKKL